MLAAAEWPTAACSHRLPALPRLIHRAVSHAWQQPHAADRSTHRVDAGTRPQPHARGWWPDSDDPTHEAIDSVLGDSAAYRHRLEGVNALVNVAGRTSWPVSRILFRTAYATRRRPSIWAHRRRVPQAAYPQIRASSPQTPARPHRSAVFLALLRVGFTEPYRSPGTLVRSYRTVSPLPPRWWRSVFCGTFPRVTSGCR